MTDINPLKIQQLHTMLTTAEHPVIVTHMRPDGDAIGSSMGMYHMLREIYSKQAKVAIANPAPGYLDFMFSEDNLGPEKE